MPNGLLPSQVASVTQVLDAERWAMAEERTAELIACIQPNQPSEERRKAVALYVQRLIMKSFSYQILQACIHETMSVRNKANRAKQSTSTICGRKSFASVLYDMRNPKTEVDPDLIEYWKATHQRRTDDTWCSDKAKNDMNQLEHVRKSQDELGDPPLSTEEYLTQAFGARFGYLRGLGCGPRPLSIKNLEAKASQEAFERQIEDLKNQLKDENEEREARLQREKDERDERFKKEIEKMR